jgi:hypothetical protein
MMEKRINPLVQRIKYLYPRVGVFLLFVGFVVCLFIFPFTITNDGKIRYQFMDTLVHQLHIVPMKYSMVGPLFSLPLWLISSFLKLKDPSSIIERYNFLLFVLIILILYLWLKNQFEKKFLLTFFFILAFGSMFPAHLINYFGEVFSAVCLTLGSVGLALNKKWVGWSLLILAVLNTPALLVPFTLVVLYIIWESKKIRHLFFLPACLILMVVESYLRTNSITAGFQTYISQDQGFKTVLPYSGGVGFSYPFAFGVLSILLSFGKGLIFYCPGLLLIGWAWKYISDPVERKMIVLWFLILAGLILVYASWWAWYGGNFWGPRFFLFASVPASWILARLLHTRERSLLISVVLLLFVTLSFWVGVNGVVFNQRTLDICSANNYALEHLCWYVPEFSALWRPFVVHHVFSKRLPLLFAITWLYIVSPLAIVLYDQLKTTFQANRSLFRLSSWKF